MSATVTAVAAGCVDFDSLDDSGYDGDGRAGTDAGEGRDDEDGGPDGIEHEGPVPDGVEVVERTIDVGLAHDGDEVGFTATVDVFIRVDDEWTGDPYTATIGVDGEERGDLEVAPEEARAAIDEWVDDTGYESDVARVHRTIAIETSDPPTVEIHDGDGTASKTADVLPEWPAPHRTAANVGLDLNVTVHPDELYVLERWAYPDLPVDVPNVGTPRPTNCIFADETLYVNVAATDSDGDSSGEHVVLAMDGDSGELQWSATPQLDGDTEAGQLGWMVYDEGRLYTVTADRNEPPVVYALDGGDGSLTWHRPLEREWSDTWLTVGDDALYAAPSDEREDGLVELAPTDGTVRRERDTGGPVAVRDGRCYVPETATRLVAVEPDFSDPIWEYETPVGLFIVQDRTVVTDEYVFLQARTDRDPWDTYLFVLDADDGTVLDEDGYLIADQDPMFNNPGYASPAVPSELLGEPLAFVVSQTHGFEQIPVGHSSRRGGRGFDDVYTAPFVTGRFAYHHGPEEDQLRGMRLSTAEHPPFPTPPVELGSDLGSRSTLVFANGVFYAACEDEIVLVTAEGVGTDEGVEGTVSRQ